MDITWYGYSSFSVKTKNGSLVVDPYKNIDLKMPSVKADVVVISDENNGTYSAENIGGEPKVLTWPGEYEVAGIAITAMEVAPGAAKKDATKPMIYSFDADGLKVCYITDFAAALTEELMESIGDVDILMVPAGKPDTNLEEIHKSIEEIEPRIVIPMYYNTPGLKADLKELEPFLKKTASSKPKPKKNSPSHPAPTSPKKKPNS